MRKLLVTGGAGFIGGNFVHYWRQHHPGDHLVILDALTYAGNIATIEALITQDGVVFVHGDVSNESIVGEVFGRYDIDTVVHFAAESHVDRSIVEPGAFVRANVVGTQVLLDAARRAWFTNGTWKSNVRFHHVSTDEVYGSLAPHDPPFTETSPYAPSSPYAASKAGADHLVRAYIHTYGLPASISNCSNNYGPYQFPEKLIPLMVVSALEGNSLPVYGDGLQVRDWLYVHDHCVAIEQILLADVTGSVFNVGGRAEITNIEIVNRLCAVLDEQFAHNEMLASRFPRCPGASGASCATLISHVRDRPGHDRRYAIDESRIAAALGFTPRESLASGLQKTVAWYLDNEPWWRGVMDGSYRDWITAQYG